MCLGHKANGRRMWSVGAGSAVPAWPSQEHAVWLPEVNGRARQEPAPTKLVVMNQRYPLASLPQRTMSSN